MGPNWLLAVHMAVSQLGLIPEAKSSFKVSSFKGKFRSGWMKSNGIHSDKTFLLLVMG